MQTSRRIYSFLKFQSGNLKCKTNLVWACAILACCICAYEWMSQTIPTPSSQHATVDCRPFWNFGTVTALAPMLGQYTCMGINNNINNGIRERTHEYQKCNSSRILIFGGYIYLGERIFVYSSYYLGYSYSNHIQIRMIYLCMKVLVWYIDSNGVNNKNTTKDPYPTGIIMV